MKRRSFLASCLALVTAPVAVLKMSGKKVPDACWDTAQYHGAPLPILYGLCHGPAESISEIRINGQPVALRYEHGGWTVLDASTIARIYEP